MNNGKPIIQPTIVFISILQENIHSLPPQSIQMSFVEVKIGSKPKILGYKLDAVRASLESKNFQLKIQVICSPVYPKYSEGKRTG